MALLGIISANLSPDAWTHTPVVPLVHIPVSSQETSAFATSGPARLPTTSALRLLYGRYFRGYSHSFMFRLPRSLGPQIAPTAVPLSKLGSRAVYTTHSPDGYLPRDVASLRIRHEQVIRLDFHQLDCSLVGCSNIPLHENNRQTSSARF